MRSIRALDALVINLLVRKQFCGYIEIHSLDIGERIWERDVEVRVRSHPGPLFSCGLYEESHSLDAFCFHFLLQVAA